MKDKIENIEVQQPRNKYRYACPACTNVAFYSPEKKHETPVTCGSCGKILSELQEENYIKL